MDRYPICNHKENTAPHLFGKVFVLCWRCTGVMISLIIMSVVRLLTKVNFGWVQAVLGLLFVFPMICDGILHYFCSRGTTNLKRFITGILFGIGYSLIVFVFY